MKEFTQKKEKSNLEMVNRSMLQYQERGLELAKIEIKRSREKTFEWEEEKKIRLSPEYSKDNFDS